MRDRGEVSPLPCSGPAVLRNMPANSKDTSFTIIEKIPPNDARTLIPNAARRVGLLWAALLFLIVRIGDAASGSWRFRPSGYLTEQPAQDISTAPRTRSLVVADMPDAAVTIDVQSTLLFPVHVSSRD